MLNDPKVEQKLLQTLSEFSGMVLRNAKISERYVDGRDVVILEVLFSSKIDPSQTKTAVFALDKELTIRAHEEVIKQLLDETDK